MRKARNIEAVNAHTMFYLGEDRVRELLHWEPLIDSMEDALAAFSTGRVRQPVRSVITIEEQRKFLGIMPAATDDVMGAKLVSFFPANEGTEYPTHNGTIVLLNARTGVPLVAMDARLITEMRTAAVSAAITRYLMPEGAHVLALLGSGVQAHAHLEALAHVVHFDDVRVWSRTTENAERFAQEHRARPTTAEEAVRDADVVVVATSSREPVLRGAWLKPGAHVNAVGANRFDWRELDDAAMRNTVVVDSREAMAKESGDVILSNAEIYAEIGEIFAKRMAPPPRSATTIFKSGGLATEDLYAANLVYTLSLESSSQ